MSNRRPRPTNAAMQAAAAACAIALTGKKCTKCGDPATTARTPTGAPSFDQLAKGAGGDDLASILANSDDFRCDAHRRRGRPRAYKKQTAEQYGKALLGAFLARSTCADPACDDPPAEGFTPPGMPRLGELGKGRHLDRFGEITTAAVLYCDRHSQARITGDIDPAIGQDANVAAAGGPHKMVLALAGARHEEHLAGLLGISQAVVAAAYAEIGVDPHLVLRHVRGDNLDLPTPAGARKSPAKRVAAIGDLHQALRQLATSTSRRHLARLVRGSESSGTVDALTTNFAALGVDLNLYFPQRLRDYR